MMQQNGLIKKLWRCNQWWGKRCRARVYTIGDIVTPLNKYHTHEDIIKRKKRVARKKATTLADDQVQFFIVQSDKKDASEEEEPLFVDFNN